jgi:hypothetical protein
MTFIKQAGYDNALALLGLYKEAINMAPPLAKPGGGTRPTLGGMQPNTMAMRKAPAAPPLRPRKPARPRPGRPPAQPHLTNFARS